MPDEIDWSLTTFEGNRRRQHLEFLALPFREKLDRIEQMNEVVEFFAAKRTASDGRTNTEAKNKRHPER